MKNSTNFDVIIVGAGPAGIICAMQLAKKGYQIALFEKETFPRDKTCGDALSVDILNQLELIDADLAKRFLAFSKKIPSYGVKIIAPSTESFDIPFFYKGIKRSAFIAKRIDFDDFLFNELRQFRTISIFENSKVCDIKMENDFTRVALQNGENYTAQLIVGSDGAHSVVKKILGNNKVNPNHYSAGLRVYYENVSHFNEENYIELHFFKEILPGYLWIFPLPNNQANVGIGMLSKYVSKKNVNLKKTLEELLKTHPSLKNRFKNAIPLEKPKGFGLPLGNRKRKISGNRYLLLGDAAGLIDPFSGEGIGNAIRSGRVAAIHLESCFIQHNFSKTKNKEYDIEIYKRMGTEFKVSKWLQKICKYPRLFNFIVSKANSNKYLKEFLIGTMENIEKKKLLMSPIFYFKLFFR